jgi:hypothetical protein
VEQSPPLMRLCFFTENDTRALVMSSCLGVRATPVADPGLKTCGAKLVDFKLINTIYSAYSAYSMHVRKNCGARWPHSLHVDPPLSQST